MKEIAYTRSGYIRVVHIKDCYYEVQAKSIRGQNKRGELLFWKKVYGVWNREKAITLMENYS